MTMTNQRSLKECMDAAAGKYYAGTSDCLTPAELWFGVEERERQWKSKKAWAKFVTSDDTKLVDAIMAYVAKQFPQARVVLPEHADFDSVWVIQSDFDPFDIVYRVNGIYYGRYGRGWRNRKPPRPLDVIAVFVKRDWGQ